MPKKVKNRIREAEAEEEKTKGRVRRSPVCIPRLKERMFVGPGVMDAKIEKAIKLKK